jgi:hypothetical protein
VGPTTSARSSTGRWFEFVHVCRRPSGDVSGSDRSLGDDRSAFHVCRRSLGDVGRGGRRPSLWAGVCCRPADGGMLTEVGSAREFAKQPRTV